MYKKSILTLVLFLLFSVQQGFGYDTKSTPEKTIIQIEDIYIDGQGIFVHLDGKEFAVQSLQKTASGWEAKVENIIPYCIGGHPACPSCESCHLSGCPFYIPSCFD